MGCRVYGGKSMNDDKKISFMEFIKGTDKDFYEAFLVNLSEEELQRFMEDNPDFSCNKI